MNLIECIWCGKETIGKTVCSQRCQELIDFKKQNFENHTCSRCHKIFIRRKNSKKNYCSHKCENGI